MKKSVFFLSLILGSRAFPATSLYLNLNFGQAQIEKAYQQTIDRPMYSFDLGAQKDFKYLDISLDAGTGRFSNTMSLDAKASLNGTYFFLRNKIAAGVGEAYNSFNSLTWSNAMSFTGAPAHEFSPCLQLKVESFGLVRVEVERLFFSKIGWKGKVGANILRW